MRGPAAGSLPPPSGVSRPRDARPPWQGLLLGLVVAPVAAGWGPVPARGKSDLPAAVEPAATGGRNPGKAPTAGPDSGDDGPAAAPIARDMAGFDCVVAAETAADSDLEVRCAVPVRPDFAKAVLRFRPATRASYFSRVMVPSGGPSWRATIPAHLLTGRSLQVFVEVTDRSSRPVVTWNTNESPHVVMLRAQGNAGRADEQAELPGEEEENPLEDEEDEPPPFRQRRFWVGLAAGDGLGWSLESGTVADAAKPARARDLHVAPEVGYQLAPRLALAIGGRHQWLQQPSRGTSGPAGAHLGLLRVMAFTGTGRHRGYAAGVVGVGNGFRLVPSTEDLGSGQARRSVRGGPFVGGVAMGYVGDLDGSRLAFTAELGGLAGFPGDRAVVVDLRIGLAAYF